MIVVQARDPQRRLGSVSFGSAFRVRDSDGLYFLSNHSGGRGFRVARLDGRIIEDDKFTEDLVVIPAKVLLVEKGADLKDVAEALEKL